MKKSVVFNNQFNLKFGGQFELENGGQFAPEMVVNLHWKVVINLTGFSSNVHIDEFVVGGKEEGKPGRSYDSKKKKAVCAVQLTDEGKVKRFYAMKIDDYSTKSLNTLFEKHISKDAKITTDEWKSYKPLAKQYDITQIPSKNGANFKALHTMIHQVKSWIRTTYSWVSSKNIDRYFDEFCYRINRSQNKDTIFNNLIKRMITTDNITHKKILCS